ncbi:MAG: HNH endonuclease [Clostridia bacterium]|jgi:hypothetical protein
MSTAFIRVPMRIKLIKDQNPPDAVQSKQAITVKRNGEILDVIDRETALNLHQKKIIHFEPSRKTAFILSSNRDYVYYRENGLCFYCHIQLTKENATMDHLHPRSKGGQASVSNLVLSCQSCNNLKGSRNVKQFLSNPYDVVGRNNIPTHYFITPAALKDFQHITRNNSYSFKEMYYYLLNECELRCHGGNTTCYLSPKLIFYCEGMKIIKVKRNNLLNRFPLLSYHKKCHSLSKRNTLLYIPSLKAIHQYRKIVKRHLPLDVVIRRLNNALFFEKNIRYSLGNITLVCHGKIIIILHKGKICAVKSMHPFLYGFLHMKLSEESDQYFLKEALDRLSLSQRAIRQYRYHVRNSPISKIKKKIRNTPLHNSRIVRIHNQHIVIHSGNFIFTVLGYEIAEIKVLRKYRQPFSGK